MIKSNILLVGSMLFSLSMMAQQLDSIQEVDIETESELLEADVAMVEDTVQTYTKKKLDGIAAVVGDYVILESDIEKTLIDLRSQGASVEDVTACGLLGKLMEDRLYAHQAVQDSLLVSDAEVNAEGDRQLQQLVQQIGSMEKVLKFYRKESEASFRENLYEINN